MYRGDPTADYAGGSMRFNRSATRDACIARLISEDRKVHRKSDGSITFQCPSCDSSRQSAWMGQGGWRCLRCDASGSLSHLAELLGVRVLRTSGGGQSAFRRNLRRPKPKVLNPVVPIEQTQEAERLMRHFLRSSDPLTYLATRGLTPDRLRSSGVFEGRVPEGLSPWGREHPVTAFAYMDPDMGLTTFRFRNMLDHGNRYMSMKGHAMRWPFGSEYLFGSPETVHVTEGEIDCLTLREYDLRAIGLPGANPSAVVLDNTALTLRALGVSRIVLWHDPDDAGTVGAKKFQQTLSDIRFTGDVIPVHLPDGMDVNDLHRSGDLYEKIPLPR